MTKAREQIDALAELYGEPDCLRSGVGGGMAAGAMVTAIHECAHGVAAEHFGASSIRCWIDGEAGRCTWQTAFPFSKIERLVVCMAGPIAENRYTGNNDREFWKWRDVIKTQREIGRFMFVADDPLFNQAYRLASALVADRWLEIRRHAFALAKFKTLNL